MHVAIDLPSGMYADEPEPPDYLSWFLADMTVTFHRMKTAHLHRWTARSCGKVAVRDIGLDPWHDAAWRMT
jgi:NAD(P)H-hydrate repair Nnr-like enzyme with NAD(P)H-hydrate epimerase domain